MIFIQCALSSCNDPDELTEEIRIQCSGVTVDLVLGPTILNIPGNFFDGYSQLETVNIQGPATIGNNAFYRCQKLCKVEFSSDCTLTGDAIFGWGSLTIDFIIPQNQKSIKYENDCLYSILPNCHTLIFMNLNFSGEYRLPSDVTKIGRLSCFQVKGITKFIFHENITEIGTSFHWFFTPNVVIEVPNTKDFNLSNEHLLVWRNTMFWVDKRLKQFVFPEGIRKFDWKACSDAQLEDVVMPSTLEELGYQTVKKVNLKTINFTNQGPLKLDKETFHASSIKKIVFEGPAENIEFPTVPFTNAKIRFMSFRCEDEGKVRRLDSLVVYRCNYSKVNNHHMRSGSKRAIFFLVLSLYSK